MIDMDGESHLGTMTQKFVDALTRPLEIERAIRPDTHNKAINLRWFLYKFARRQDWKQALASLLRLLHFIPSIQAQLLGILPGVFGFINFTNSGYPFSETPQALAYLSDLFFAYAHHVTQLLLYFTALR